MICNTCRVVVDVIVGTHAPNLISADELNQCPECEGSDLTLWDESRHCPHCNGTMEVDPAEPTILFD
jgi:DnaJ-class molecular chaperone